MAAAAYCLLSILAAARWRRPAPKCHVLPPVSILKPMYGTDSRLYEAIRSQAIQDYPEFEIGVCRDSLVQDVQEHGLVVSRDQNLRLEVSRLRVGDSCGQREEPHVPQP